MHFLPNAATIAHHGHVAGNDGGDTGLVGSVANAVHKFDVLVVNDGVHRQVALHTLHFTLPGNVAQVVNGKPARAVCPHIQGFDAEVN